jgi:hypothetical protein
MLGQENPTDYQEILDLFNRNEREAVEAAYRKYVEMGEEPPQDRSELARKLAMFISTFPSRDSVLADWAENTLLALKDMLSKQPA